MKTIEDWTPQNSWLVAEHRKSVGWTRAIAELIDNAMDANASNILITKEPARLEVKDDGDGIPNIVSLLTHGAHIDHDNARMPVGVWGVGAKDCFLWLWGKTSIETYRDGEHSFVQLDWEEESKKRGYKVEVDRKSAEGRGTVISCDSIRRRASKPQWGKVIEELSFLFSPGLQQGISVKVMEAGYAFPLWPYVPKQAENHVAFSGEVGGKTFSADVWTLPKGATNEHAGIHVVYGHRIICDLNEVLEGYSIGRIYGIVQLSSDWILTRNKDGVDEDSDALADAIFDKTSDLIVSVDEQDDNIFNDELGRELALAIFGEKPKEKEERPGEGREDGRTEPKNTGRKRRRANRHRPGDGSVEIPAKEIATECYNQGDDKIGIVKKKGDVLTVCYNASHPCIAMMYASKPKRKDVLHAFGIALLSGYIAVNIRSDEELQQSLPGFNEVEWQDCYIQGMSQFARPSVFMK